MLLINDLKLYEKNDREIESLVHMIMVFSEDIRVHLEMEKCATIKL